jgi:hypothetical protein
MHPVAACAFPRMWVGGNNDWIDDGSTANWDPADEPDDDDEAIFNTSNTVNIGSNNLIHALTMSGGIDLFLNDSDLVVNGLVQLGDNSTNLFVAGTETELSADDILIGSGGTLELESGSLVLDEDEILAAGSLTINSGGTLTGHGIVNFADSPAFTANLLNNNGTLTATTRVSVVGQLPPPNTLMIVGGGATGRIDLDGTSEGASVNVNRNQTLDIDIALADAFHGNMNLLHGSTLDIASAWTFGGGTMDIDNGATGGIPPIPAGISTITGGQLTQSGGVITVVDNDGTLQLNAPFTMNDGAFMNNGHVIFNANATIGPGAGFTMSTNTSSMTVAAGRIVTINQPNFNADGGGQTTNVLTIDSGSVLSLNLGAGADESISGLIRLNGGTFDVTTADNNWSINGSIQVAGDTAISQIGGETLTLVNVNTTIGADSTLRIAAPLNIAANANINGTGTLALNRQATVSAPATINLPGGTVDLDGTDTVGDTISVNASLVINAATMDSFGRVNSGGGVSTLHIDAVSVGATGRLTVNLDNPDDEWTLNAGGTLALSNTNSLSTLLAGVDANLNGSVNVLGSVGSSARIDFGGVMNLLSANGGFMFQGGSFEDPNRIENGVVTGLGKLQASAGRFLVGRGTINSPIDFDDTAELVAEGGTLILNAAIEDIGTLRTNGESAVLDLQLPFNTSVTQDGIAMAGGTLQGEPITTASLAQSIRGMGQVTSELINSGAVEAQSGTLKFNNPASDWDGPTNNGQLRASSAGTLEIHDGSHVAFGGSVNATGGSTISMNGFDMTYSPTSTIGLAGSTYKSTNTTHINGSVHVGAGPDSTIEVDVDRFLDFGSTSVTTLEGNLQVMNNNVNVEAGASFTGNGALIISNNSNLIADAGADINVLVDNQGSFYPGGLLDVGQVNLKGYQQSQTGELVVELSGTGLNLMDRMVVDGNVLLDGELNVSFLGGFMPVLGETFNIISAGTVSGSFDVVQGSPMPEGLMLDVKYMPTFVQLAVVAALMGDYNKNGVVDAADYVLWRSTLGDSVTPSSGADGNGNGMIDNLDYDVWRANFGFTATSGAAALGRAAETNIPEPATCLLLGVAILSLVAVRRR